MLQFGERVALVSGLAFDPESGNSVHVPLFVSITSSQINNLMETHLRTFRYAIDHWQSSNICSLQKLWIVEMIQHFVLIPSETNIYFLNKNETYKCIKSQITIFCSLSRISRVTFPFSDLNRGLIEWVLLLLLRGRIKCQIWKCESM